MTKPKDDLEAVRDVLQALEGFEEEDQKRILRWTNEKLGFFSPREQQARDPDLDKGGQNNANSFSDIKSFIAAKSPQSDMHFAASVAYFYKFQAAASSKRDEIGSEDLQEACRLANRSRLGSPIKTLNNALNAGLLDKGTGRGFFSLNTVGENLVAMTLPILGSAPNQKKKTKK